MAAKKTSKAVEGSDEEEEILLVNELERASSDEAGGNEDNDDDEESGSGSSDEEDEAELTLKLPKLPVEKLSSTKQQIKGESSSSKTAKKSSSTEKAPVPAVIYLGRLPRGFEEPALRSYLTQFGEINKLRVSRNKKVNH